MLNLIIFSEALGDSKKMIESEELRYHQADHERIADLEFKVIFCQVVIAALAALLVVSVIF